MDYINTESKIKNPADYSSSFVPFCMPIYKFLPEVLHRAPNIIYLIIFSIYLSL